MKWISRRINRFRALCGAVLVGVVVAAGLAGPGLAGASSGTAAGSARSSVIVVLKNQLAATPDSRLHASARSDSAADTQAPLVGAVRASGGTVTDQFHLLNAFAADVDSSELAALRADPAVAQVVPNQSLAPATGSSLPTSWAQAAANGAQDVPSSPSTVTVAPQTRTARTASPLSVPLVSGSTVCGTAADPLLEPEALQLTHTAPLTATASTVGTERSTGIDGSGVTVAEISNIVDPTNADLIRQPSGTPAVTNVDMTGDGTNTGGDEGWGDVSAIVAQGNETYDLSTQSGFSNPAIGSGCDIKIEGVAPGAGVYAIGANDTDVSYLTAIDYAVSTLHVNVLNESFGTNYIPSGELDMFQMADDQAYAAGVTVVVASGDAGPTSTIEDPADDPNVISVGASTAFRTASQSATSGAGLMTLGAGFQGGTAGTPDGWVDNSPAALSSSGPDQQDGTVDLLAPGDSGWSLCSAASSGGDCSGPIDDFGGTSQSAPLVAGAAALIIQAYKQTHAGALPGPALVKQILMSSADDIDAAGENQGAGLLDTDAAVQEAESPVVGSGGTGTAPAQTGLLVSTGAPSGTRQGQLDVVGTAGSTTSESVSVTNTGSASEIVTPALRELTDTLSSTTGSIGLDGISGTSAPYINDDGYNEAYKSFTFNVPAGTDVLTGQEAWPSTSGQYVELTLVDPSGRYAANSNLQSTSTNTGRVQVAGPEPGTWTAYFRTPIEASGFDGTVNYAFTSTAFAPAGTVTPGSRTLAPGASGTFTVPLTLPASGGDASQEVALSTALPASPGTTVSTTVVPIALRALVPLSASGGSFSGEATGGNGRNGWGQTEDFEFEVPAGTPALTVDVAGPDGSTIDGIPIDPQGNTPGFAETRDPNTGDATTDLESVVLNPQPGLWTYVVAIYNNASGLAVQAPFTGTISFGAPDAVTPSGVPQSASTFIAPGGSASATVRVQNTGAVPLAASVDPRLNSIGSVPLTVTYPSGSSLGLPSLYGNATVIVPPDTAQLNSAMQTTVGAGADFSLGWEGCCAELASGASSAAGTASLSVGSVPASITISPGPWWLTPNLLGPFASPTTITGTATFTVTAETPLFDTSVTSSTGDPWLSANSASAPSYTPLAISPGSSGTISLTFSPPAGTPVGTVVSGMLNVETFDSSLDQGTTLAQVPYEYTVGTAAAAPAGPTTTATATTTTTTVTGTTGSAKPDRATVKKLTVKGTAAVVSVACQGSAGTSCSLTLKLLRGKGRQAKVAGSLTAQVRAGLTSKVTVRLTKATVRLVAHQPGHRLKLTLTVAQSNPGKKPTTLTTRTFTFRS